MLWTKGSWELENTMEKSSLLLRISKSANISKGSNKSIKKGFQVKAKKYSWKCNACYFIELKRGQRDWPWSHPCKGIGEDPVRGESIHEWSMMGSVFESQKSLSYETNSSAILNQGHLFICVVNIQYSILWKCFYLICAYQNKVIAFFKKKIYI